MRIPRKAPTFKDSFGAIPPGRLQGVLEASRQVPDQDRYFHWEDFQYRQPPEGLSREEWWAVTKLRRIGLRTAVPLLDKENEVFSYAAVDPIPRRLHEIDLGAAGKIQMPEQVTNADTRDQYYVSSLMEEAITSSQLEGASTTRRVAKEMLRTGRPPRDPSERMILNNYVTMRRIGELRSRDLTKDLIFELHHLVTDGTLDDPTAAGRFRRPDEEIGVYDRQDQERLLHAPPPAEQLEERIQRLCRFANGPEGPFVHPVIRSIIVHFMIGYDHPFVDGNGRTARALFYWSMLRNNYWLAEFISISHIILKAPTKYAMAYLQTETDESDLTYFILYNLDVMMRALKTLHEYIARKASELRDLEDELAGIQLLNHRQKALIRHANKHPGKRYLVEEHRRSHNVSYETARSDLLDLVERKLMSADRQGKKWIFTPMPQLHGRLASMTDRGSTTLL